MAAPTNGPYGTSGTVYDPTGADTNPLPAPWVRAFGTADNSNFQTVSNKIATTSSNTAACQMFKENDAYGLDCEFWMEIATKGGDTTYFDLDCMIVDPKAASRDAYALELTFNAGTDGWALFKLLDGTWSSLATGSQEVTAGDSVAISLIRSGSSVDLAGWYWDLAGSSWSSIVTYTDATPNLAPGFVGLEASRGSAWTGGAIRGGKIVRSLLTFSDFPKPKLST